jgi:hypothetical protein
MWSSGSRVGDIEDEFESHLKKNKPKGVLAMFDIAKRLGRVVGC